MPAGIFNITIEKRSTFSFDATFTQQDGNPLNLADRNLFGEIRRDSDNAKEASFSIAKIDAAAGKASISLSKTETANLTDNICSYDIFADHVSDGTSLKVLQGSVTIVKNITSA